MKRGEKVQVRAYPNKILSVVVVSTNKTKVFICTEEEWDSASNDHREPDCIGFPSSDVMPA
jgi:hypothetical protein